MQLWFSGMLPSWLLGPAVDRELANMQRKALEEREKGK